MNYLEHTLVQHGWFGKEKTVFQFFSCKACGNMVIDTDVHDKWHAYVKLPSKNFMGEKIN